VRQATYKRELQGKKRGEYVGGLPLTSFQPCRLSYDEMKANVEAAFKALSQKEARSMPVPD